MLSKLKISQKLIIGFGFTLLIILILTITFIYQKKEIEKNSLWVLHTVEVLHDSKEIQKMVSDMETGIRGFLLTGNNDFLGPYTDSKNNIKHKLEGLTLLVKDNPAQLNKLKIFKTNLDDWLIEFAYPLLEARKFQNEEEKKLYDKLYQQKVLKAKGKYFTDVMRELMVEFDDMEADLQKKRNHQLQASLNTTNLLVITLAVVALITTIMLGYAISKSIQTRITTMVKYSENIAMGKFTERLSGQSHDELTALADSLNIMADKLDLAFQDLKRTNGELDQFAYIVSHDLKAPLRAFSSVITWLEEDLGEQVKGEIAAHFVTLKSRISRMEGLINGLLEYSRIGRQKLEKERVNVNHVLTELKENYIPNQNLEIVLQSDFPVITGQKLRVKQIFQNLLDNAVKYGNPVNNRIEISWME